ncbi:MAG: ABC transporter substrate-binding protein [Lachnospiraceae bacterium]|nr:ABC transporter substrate-binding protein [Lachnospiraceae bacterium]
MSKVTIIFERIIMQMIVVVACCALFLCGCSNPLSNNDATNNAADNGSNNAADNGLNNAADNGSNNATDNSEKNSQGASVDDWKQMKKTGEMELEFANQFRVDYYDDYDLITIADKEKYLLIPENRSTPNNLEKDVTPIKMPLQNMYVVSSASMDLFRELDALDFVKMTGTKSADWSIDSIRKMVDSGKILYGGKYSAPDYEMILKNKCDFALESTMIFHNPKVKEELESFGIPVMVERLSYESEPLGRAEWIKLFGLLTGKNEIADAYMDDCSRRYDAVLNKVSKNIDSDVPKKDSSNSQNSRPKVAFFYISSNGYVNIRKPGDYITKMIEIAGGSYAFCDVVLEEENALSTMNLQMESFYEKAIDADIIIYNSTIDGEIETVEQLLAKSPLLKDFKAVKNHNAWCTGKNMFQETTGTIGMIEDLYRVINGEDETELKYLHKLRD